MNKGDNVKLRKADTKGVVTSTNSEWVYVKWEGSSIALPYREDWLILTEEEGEHEPG